MPTLDDLLDDAEEKLKGRRAKREQLDALGDDVKTAIDAEMKDIRAGTGLAKVLERVQRVAAAAAMRSLTGGALG